MVDFYRRQDFKRRDVTRRFLSISHLTKDPGFVPLWNDVSIISKTQLYKKKSFFRVTLPSYTLRYKFAKNNSKGHHSEKKKSAIPTNGVWRLRSLWETPAALIALCLWHPRHRPPLTDSMKKSSLKLSTSLMIIKSTVAIKQAMSMIQSTEV